MTLAAERWPAYVDPEARDKRAVARSNGIAGLLVVWRIELVKLSHLIHVRAMIGLGIVGPFLVLAFLHLQSATPRDTPFGQWVHTIGLALPMTILGFGGPWILPAITAIVAGDIYSSEDHFGTWKTILTRSRTRGELFAGKYLAALTWAVGIVVLLTAADILAGLVAGREPVVGLGGQLVPAGHAVGLVAASYLSDLAPVLGFTALAVLLSVAFRNSIAGIGGTIVIAVLFQIVTLANLPAWAQQVLLSTPLTAWHGFWGAPSYDGPFLWGLVTCAAWFAVCTLGAWLIFRRRTIGAAS